jgi:tetratricopeptide (TPR) repeat protein
MNETHTEPISGTTIVETAVSPNTIQPEQLTILFNRGWGYLINRQWRRAEETFAQIVSVNSHYEQDGLSAKYLCKKARYERKAATALAEGKLAKALDAYKKADDFKRAQRIQQLLTIQELEARAEKAISVANYQEAAWVYDHLLNKYAGDDNETAWQIKKESCWEAELLPYFQIGVQAIEKQQWRTAFNSFAQVLVIDPYFRYDGRSAAALSETARKEVVLMADQQLRRGEVHQALAAYREVGHLARIENVDEFLRLRLREEENAQQLEAEGKWPEAAAKYKYLCTLYYDENGRNQWQTSATRCQTEYKLSTLYEQGMAAFNAEQWREAARLFGQIMALRPDYQPGEQPTNKLYRAARWRSLVSRFISQLNNPPPIPTGKIS